MDRNKAKGMLWGLVVGDAFGSPIQFSGRDSHPWITEMVACPVFGLPPGYWTDDGSMANTAKRLPILHSSVPKASIKVDLPAPGTPVMPSRIELPA